MREGARIRPVGWWGRGAAVLLAVAACAPASAEGQQCLTKLERQIENDHPTVGSLLPQQVETLLREHRDVLLLDVREASEFEVSRKPGAIRVEPDLSAAAFAARFGDQIAGRPVLLYCSVGVRSSRLAQRVADIAARHGATGVYNIRGGIFAWHNYGISLVEAKGGTDLVHPYSRRWSRYLDFPDYASFGARAGWW